MSAAASLLTPRSSSSWLLLAKLKRGPPRGSLAMVDQYAPMPEDREIIVQKEEGAIYAKRSLRGGQTFLIVKVFYDLQIIENLLDVLDFTVTVQKLDDIFFFLQAQRKAS